MMKRWGASFLLTSSLWTAFTLSDSPSKVQGFAQTQANPELFYTFYGQQIPLILRQDTIAVSFRPTVGTRGSGTLLYLQLQQDLQRGNTRSRGSSHSSLEVEVKLLGENYALVTLPAEAQSRDSINQQIQQRSYVETVLPVLTLSEAETGENRADIILPNEIIVSFEPDLSNTQIQTILNRHGLEVVRSLLFTENRYIVRSCTETGVAVLDVATRLNGAVGIQSATPNFVQSLAYQVQTGTIGVAPEAEILPVRVFGLNGEMTAARLIEAIGYAADRNADILNMSLRGLLPDQGLTDQIFQVLDQHPDLVIVASAGNDSLDGVSFPAATPGMLSVGATNLDGKRTFYSSFGGQLDVVALGGETDTVLGQGILTIGGTGLDGFWEGLILPNYRWGYALDPNGQYVQVQGISFSAPAVSGVVALMKGVNPSLSRDRLLSILKTTSSYDGLTLSQADRNYYRLQREVGLTQLEDQLSGIFPLPQPISAEQYFFGSGLVNAEAAVRATKRM